MFFIISAHTGNNVEINSNNTLALIDSLIGLKAKFRACTGSYKGVQEQSFLVKMDHRINLKVMISLVKHFNQDSGLLLDNNIGTLFYGNGRIEKLEGQFQEIDKNEAMNIDAWTKIENRFFTIKG